MRIQQRLGEQTVPLRLYTIDAEQVPILLGLRTLVKLVAIIDVSGPWMVLASVSPEVKIPPTESRAGHFLVSSTEDRLIQNEPLQDDMKSFAAYMVFGGHGNVDSPRFKTSMNHQIFNFNKTAAKPVSSQSSFAAEAAACQSENDDEAM